MDADATTKINPSHVAKILAGQTLVETVPVVKTIVTRETNGGVTNRVATLRMIGTSRILVLVAVAIEAEVAIEIKMYRRLTIQTICPIQSWTIRTKWATSQARVPNRIEIVDGAGDAIVIARRLRIAAETVAALGMNRMTI